MFCFITHQNVLLEKGSGCRRRCSDGGSRGGRFVTSCVTRELQDESQVGNGWEASEGSCACRCSRENWTLSLDSFCTFFTVSCKTVTFYCAEAEYFNQTSASTLAVIQFFFVSAQVAELQQDRLYSTGGGSECNCSRWQAAISLWLYRVEWAAAGLNKKIPSEAFMSRTD